MLLPEGWSEVTDPTSGHPYFFHAATNETTWVRPKPVDPGPPPGPPPPSAKSDALPEGWQQATDDASGHVYYWNAGTGERSWVKPKSEEVAAPQGPELWQPEAEESPWETEWRQAKKKKGGKKQPWDHLRGQARRDAKQRHEAGLPTLPEHEPEKASDPSQNIKALVAVKMKQKDMMDVSHEDYSTDWACSAQGSKEEIEARDQAQVARMAERRKKAAEFEQAAQQRQEEVAAKVAGLEKKRKREEKGGGKQGAAGILGPMPGGPQGDAMR